MIAFEFTLAESLLTSVNAQDPTAFAGDGPRLLQANGVRWSALQPGA